MLGAIGRFPRIRITPGKGFVCLYPARSAPATINSCIFSLRTGPPLRYIVRVVVGSSHVLPPKRMKWPIRCIHEIKPSNTNVGRANMKRIIAIFVVGATSSALAYLPGNWTPEHAASDFAESDAIVVARVIGLNRTIVTNQPHGQVEFHATFVVGKSIRGSLARHESFSFLIGQDTVGNPPNEDIPRLGLLLHNTQQSYHFEINSVYLLCLSKTERGWQPRSGPYSVFRIQRERRMTDTPRLLVDPRGNKKEAQDHVVTQVREFNGVALEKFVSGKLKTRDAQQQIAP